ncbi:TrbG/VirB9 family P-type conjugative transfer protein [Facilibium subflavum]|uniref:TrbG/VirB9 family P-type conjugative transfer protein n=1 Tax=Facilibium subflavum TaxID=2219058 RepID=UPI000E64D86A|nr:TrbG/VirB9 family P-type conjugative transfer protein [Facilibium subflavum]
MKLKTLTHFIPLTTIALSGCASNSYQSDIDSGKFVQAKSQAQSMKIVKEYVPVPVPGQLRPVPNTKAQQATNPPQKTKESAVQEANKQALQYPEQNDFFNAMMTYNYMPGALYTIYTAPLTITDIVFQKGEKIISQAAGDTLRWQIASTYSGDEKNLRWHILVKPQKDNLTNSMIITTNKRTYHLVLKSVEPDQAMVSVKWHYPGDMVEGFNGGDLGSMNADSSDGSNKLPPPPKAAAGDLNIDISSMKFNYNWRMLKGDVPSWYPQQIFSAGHQTYIKFPHEVVVQNAMMPVPFVQSGDGSYGTSDFNWRMQGDYMVIDTVIKDAYLKTGTKKSGETVVQISIKDA